MLFSTGNLAVLLCQQGKYAKAEAMHRQALQLLETALGKDHVYTFKSMTVLAVSLHHQNEYAEADVLHAHIYRMLYIITSLACPDLIEG